jgi:membrane associated rhomboid family serine protease
LAFIPLHDANPLRHIGRPWVAWGIIAANIVIYLTVAVGGENAAQASAFTFGLIPAAFNNIAERPDELMAVPDAATLITYSFLHADLLHLAGNMLFLWVFADNVEDALGHVRYLIFYLLCAAAAGYAFVLSDPSSEIPVIGASGAVGGNIGAYLLLHPRAKIWILLLLRIPLRLSAMYVLGFWILFQLFAAFGGVGEEGIAWWAHLGGLVAGAVLVIFMRRRGVPLLAGEPDVATAVRRRDDSSGGPWDR